HHSPSANSSSACRADAASSLRTTSLPASRPIEFTARSGIRSPTRGAPRTLRCTTRNAMPAGRAATACSAASERWSALKARTRKRYRSTRNAMVVDRDVVLRIASDGGRLGPERELAPLVAFADLDGRLGRARPLAQQRLAVKHHRVSGLDRAERLRVRRDLLARGVDERARDAHVAGREVFVALDLDVREREERVVPVARGAEHALGEVLLEAAAVLLEPGVVHGRERDDERVRHEGLAERDRLVGLHRSDEALGDLDRLELRAEEPGAPALDHPARERLKPLHASSRPPRR